MSKFEHIEGLPYVVTDQLGSVVGRTAERSVAEHLLNSFYGGSGAVHFTGSAEKIREDATFIYWVGKTTGMTMYARRVGHPKNKVWEVSGEDLAVYEDDLLTILISDTPYEVLDRRAD